MKRLPILSCLIALALGLPTLAVAAERTQVLRAIHQVENPHNRTQPGPRGELGAYQFRRSTWFMHSQEPFSRANDRTASDAVAAMHYEWIKRGLVKAGMEPSAYNIALAWNGGLQAVTSRRVPASSRRYATRVANLVAEAERLQQAAILVSLRTAAAGL
jgi:hypothetical protein